MPAEMKRAGHLVAMMLAGPIVVGLLGAAARMTEVLGVNPLSPIWDNAGPGGADDALSALDALVADQLAARQSARAARDFEAADAIRDRLTEAGIVIDDTPSGARWSLARRNGG